MEQKNYTLIRAYLGHMRLDTHQQCQVLNELYDQMWLYYTPSGVAEGPQLLPACTAPSGEESDLQTDSPTDDDHHVPYLYRRHDTARTPLARLLESQVLDESQRQHLLQARRSVTPGRYIWRSCQSLRNCGGPQASPLTKVDVPVG